MKVAARIILMLNPAGAVLAALEAIYRVLKWIFTNAARIFHLIEAVVNGMADVIAGNIGGVAKMVEKALAMLIAPVIDFLADYLGLGGLPAKVAEAVQGLQAWVEGVLRTVITWLVDVGKKMLAALGFGGKEDKEKDKKAEAAGAIGESLTFSANGETHRLFVKAGGDTAQLLVASEEQSPASWLDSKEVQEKLKGLSEDKRTEAESAISKARALATQADREAKDAALARAAAEGVGANASGNASQNALFDHKNQTLAKDEESLASVLQRIGDLLGLRVPPEIKFKSGLDRMPAGSRAYGLEQLKSTGDLQWKDWSAAAAWLRDRSGFQLILGEGSRVGDDTVALAKSGAVAAVTKAAGGTIPASGLDDADEIVDRSKPKVHAKQDPYADLYARMAAFAFDSSSIGAAEASATASYDFIISPDTRFVLARIPAKDDSLISEYDSVVLPLVVGGQVRGNATGLRNQFEGTLRAKRYMFAGGFRLQMQQVLAAGKRRVQKAYPQLSGVEIRLDEMRRADYTQRHGAAENKHIIHEVKNWTGFAKKPPEEQREIVESFSAQARAYLENDASTDGELAIGGLIVEVKGELPAPVLVRKPILESLAATMGKVFEMRSI